MDPNHIFYVAVQCNIGITVRRRSNSVRNRFQQVVDIQRDNRRQYGLPY
jgi:hypothetical protein